MRVSERTATVTRGVVQTLVSGSGNLEPIAQQDVSHSTGEVLDIFARLNDEGRTIVLITHEADVAAEAERVIRLADGAVVEDVAA